MNTVKHIIKKIKFDNYNILEGSMIGIVYPRLFKYIKIADHDITIFKFSSTKLDLENKCYRLDDIETLNLIKHHCNIKDFDPSNIPLRYCVFCNEESLDFFQFYRMVQHYKINGVYKTEHYPYGYVYPLMDI